MCEIGLKEISFRHPAIFKESISWYFIENEPAQFLSLLTSDKRTWVNNYIRSIILHVFCGKH